MRQVDVSSLPASHSSNLVLLDVVLRNPVLVPQPGDSVFGYISEDPTGMKKRPRIDLDGNTLALAP